MPAKKKTKEKPVEDIPSKQKELKRTDETILMESMLTNIEILSENLDFLKEKIDSMEKILTQVRSRLGI